MRKFIILFFISAFLKSAYAQPRVSFTFDDPEPCSRAGYDWKVWNGKILNTLKQFNLQAVLFTCGKRINDSTGQQLLALWNDAGHLIANHSYSHLYFNSSKISLDTFEKDVLKCDSLICRYSNYIKLFRFPYLKEGNTACKRDSFRLFLKKYFYKNGYVTIDASDWYICDRLQKRLKENSKADTDAYKKFYLQHIFERAEFYEKLSFELTGRHINHTLLLHHNLTSALFLDDLVKMFKEKGWEVIGAGEAYKDEIYNQEPLILPAGESLVWALAKQSGKYDSILRYPGEDGDYEKEKMDKLGL